MVARGSGTLKLSINGVPSASFPLSAELQALSVRVPRDAWRRELNELRFEVAPGEGASLDKIVFTRLVR